jgi:hypothetical protein
MNNIHHKNIKRFHIDGNIHDDSALSRLRDQYFHLLVSEMRLSGYVPRLDIAPDFTIDYNEDKEYFEFELSMYGIYVGKRQSQWIEGIDETRIVYIVTNKLNESSLVVE